VIVFGSGGSAIALSLIISTAVPPLDLKLAEELIGRTRVSRLLKSYRDVPAADRTAVGLVLVKLAQLVTDIPEIKEMDLNPLLADEQGVIALDARVVVAALHPRTDRRASGHPRLAIRPYPKEWECRTRLPDGTQLSIRPIRPEDERLYPAFLQRVTPDDLRMRFFAPVKEFTHHFIARFTQIDYARAMAFVGIDEASGEMLGVARLHMLTHSDTGEYAVLVRSDLKGRGLGWLLMKTLVDYARGEGVRAIQGDVLAENTTMLRMCAELGFSVENNPNEPGVRTVKLMVA
jgi:acetyltransferase